MQHFGNSPRPTYSRWGQVDHAEELKPGIWSVSTPSHGGLIVSNERLDAMDRWMRETPYSGGGQFEEDCDWCLPVLAFAHEFGVDPIVGIAWKTFEDGIKTGYYKHPRAVLFHSVSGAIFNDPSRAIVEKTD